MSILQCNTIDSLSTCSEISDSTLLALSDEFYHKTKVRDLLNSLNPYALYINYIHCSMNSTCEITLQRIQNPDIKQTITNTCRLAESIASRKMSRVSVVIPSGFALSDPTQSDLWEKIKSLFKDLAKYFPSVDFLIENTPPYYMVDKRFFFRNGCLNDVVDIVTELRHLYGDDRFGTALNVNNAITTNIVFNNLLYTDSFNLSEFFRIHKGACKLIILSDRIVSNPFLSDDSNIDLSLSKCLDLYEKFSYKCDIALETELSDDFFKQVKENSGVINKLSAD